MKTKMILLAATAVILNTSACAAPAEIAKDIFEGSGGYRFDMTVDYIELDGKFFDCYINRPIVFDGEALPYETFLGYESPYDKYVSLFYSDGSGNYSLSDTAAFAIRYACENDVECVDFPIEYDTLTLSDAWEYARMSFPNLPLETLNSGFEISDKGFYRIRFTKTLRDVAKSTDTLSIAKDIVDNMPDTCVSQAQKAYYLYDWICQNVGYDSYHTSGKEGRVNGVAQSAYGALVEKRAVCDGIAGAVQLLFSMVGIDCGKVDSFDYSGGAGHVWNVAEIDGEIWDFDATWDICRYYDGKDDQVTEEQGSGYYEWFGVERTAKTKQLDVNDMMADYGIFTTDYYTENSPVNLSYDIVVSTDPNTYDEHIFMNGKELEEMPYEFIINKTDKGGLVSIKFNNSITMASYWSAFVDSSVMLVDYEYYDGYPDTELLSIELYPTGYWG